MEGKDPQEFLPNVYFSKTNPYYCTDTELGLDRCVCRFNSVCHVRAVHLFGIGVLS